MNIILVSDPNYGKLKGTIDYSLFNKRILRKIIEKFYNPKKQTLLIDEKVVDYYNVRSGNLSAKTAKNIAKKIFKDM